MRIALCQMQVWQGQRETNWRTAEGMLEEAARAGAQVAVLPEMWTCGYDFARLDEHAEAIDGPTRQRLAAAARSLGLWVVGGSWPLRDAEGVANASLTFASDGQLKHVYRKVHLIGLMDEDKYLRAGREAATFSLDTVEAAVMICYDLRFPELGRRYALAGAKVLFVPAEWPRQRAAHWRTLCVARAIENQAYVVAVNMVGYNDKDQFAGGSMVVDPWGETVAECNPQPGVVCVDIDLAKVDQVRTAMSVLRDVRPDVYGSGENHLGITTS
ncbi:carbon-nitrogen family hydrolase [Alicyclobacillus kakegawensis]|uniref:carbon-nitrogen family hydrolase n=1 Tax=Alicyclobacillus kakegawensis TaxID=392012 RepID=UPI00082FBA07|nr:carbon-nitrogen family hydrolase [Alicyclobacillus kakegawensis]